MGYGRDCAAANKRAEKEAQHRILAGHLRGTGWEVVTTTVVLGHCGSVFLEDMKKMEELGVERKPTEKLFKDLHSNAIRYTCSAARLYQQLRVERNRELGQRWTKGRRRAKPPQPFVLSLLFMAPCPVTGTRLLSPHHLHGRVVIFFF